MRRPRISFHGVTRGGAFDPRGGTMSHPNPDLPAVPRTKPGRAPAPPRRRAFWSGGLPYLLLAPSLLMAVVLIGLPIWVLIWTSLHDVSRFGQLLELNGLRNYAEIFADPLFWASLRRTLIWTVCVVFGSLAIGLPVALILHDDFAGRGLARVLILLPWSVSLTMMAITWKWALNGPGGLVNATLLRLGVIDRPVEWLATAGLAFALQIGVAIFASIPFVVTILLGGLASLPEDIFEAARLDGAGAIGRFRYLTLPLIWPFLGIAAILQMIYVFNSFPIIWVMTEGGPANGTDILVTYLYKLSFRFGQLGKGAAVSLVMLLILAAISALYVWIVSRQSRRQRGDAR